MNTEHIKDIIRVFEDSKLAKMELEIDDMKIKMEKGMSTLPVQEVTLSQVSNVMPATSQQDTHPEKEVPNGIWVKAPIVGTYYHSRGEGSTPYVEIGKRVHKGDVLCIIEAMKVMNEIHAPVDGVILEILVTNDSMVEFDQELIRIGEAHD